VVRQCERDPFCTALLETRHDLHDAQSQIVVDIEGCKMNDPELLAPKDSREGLRDAGTTG
jgi:hypothetical protein